jgi:mannose-6-phosphate isomerase-like protein (cupin superfamily)
MKLIRFTLLALLVCAASLGFAQSQALQHVETSKATFFSAAEMSQASAKGATLVDRSGLNFRASIGRRDTPGQVELHEGWTDLLYITKGAATFVVGGKMLNGKTTSKGEMRGEAIEGGETYHLTQGSLIIVPAGVPHWFKSIESPLVDYVVKVQKQ